MDDQHFNLQDGCHVNYTINLENIDMDLLTSFSNRRSEAIVPVWSPNARNGLEYCVFEVLAEEKHNEENDNVTCRCCICDVDVPTCYIEQHNRSKKHNMMKTLADISLERGRNQMSQPPPKQLASSSKTYYCESCNSSVAKTNQKIHDNTPGHQAHTCNLKILDLLIQMYKENGNADTLFKIHAEIKKVSDMMTYNSDKKGGNDITIDVITTDHVKNEMVGLTTLVKDATMTKVDDLTSATNESTETLDVLKDSGTMTTNDVVTELAGDDKVTKMDDVTTETKSTEVIAVFKDNEIMKTSSVPTELAAAAKVTKNNYNTAAYDEEEFDDSDNDLKEILHQINIVKVSPQRYFCNPCQVNFITATIYEHVTEIHDVVLPLDTDPRTDKRRLSVDDTNTEISEINKAGIVNGYCTACHIYLPTKDQVKQHKKSPKHRFKYWSTMEHEKMHWHVRIQNDHVHCKVCNMAIPNSLSSVHEHVKSEEHASLYNKLLNFNLMHVASDKLIVCEICGSAMSITDDINHVIGKIHKNNLKRYRKLHPLIENSDSNTNLEEASTLQSPENDEVSNSTKLLENSLLQTSYNRRLKRKMMHKKSLHYLFEFTNDPSKIRCKSCNVNVDNSLECVRLHRKKKDHKSMYEMLLYSNAMLRVRSCCYCECCDEIVKVNSEWTHMNSKDHSTNLNSMSQRLDKFVLKRIALEKYKIYRMNEKNYKNLNKKTSNKWVDDKNEEFSDAADENGEDVYVDSVIFEAKGSAIDTTSLGSTQDVKDLLSYTTAVEDACELDDVYDLQDYQSVSSHSENNDNSGNAQRNISVTSDANKDIVSLNIEKSTLETKERICNTVTIETNKNIRNEDKESSNLEIYETPKEIIEKESSVSEMHETPKRTIENESSIIEIHETPKETIENENSIVEIHETPKETIQQETSVVEIHETPKETIQHESSVVEIHETTKETIEQETSVVEIYETPKETIEQESSVVEIYETPKETIQQETSVVEIHETPKETIQQETSVVEIHETPKETIEQESSVVEIYETPKETIQQETSVVEIHETPKETIQHESSVVEIHETTKETIQQETSVVEIHETPKETIQQETSVVEIHETPKETIEQESSVVEIYETPKETIQQETSVVEIHETPKETIQHESSVVEIHETTKETIEQESSVVEIYETPKETIQQETSVVEIHETPKETIQHESSVVEIHETTKETIEQESSSLAIHETPKETIKIDSENESLNTVWHLLDEITENPKQLFCKICSCHIPVRPSLIIEHCDGIRHETRYRSLLLQNSLQETCDAYHCSVCCDDVERPELFIHVNDSDHIHNLTAKEPETKRQRQTNPKVQLKENELIIFTTTHKRYLMQKFSSADLLIYCSICDHEIHDTEADVSSHVTTETHLQKYEALLSENEIKTVGSKSFCEVCKVDIEALTELEHMYSGLHKHNFKGTRSSNISEPVKEDTTSCKITLKGTKKSINLHKQSLDHIESNRINANPRNAYLCTVCNVEVLNKTRCIELHRNGTRHKNKLREQEKSEALLNNNTEDKREDAINPHTDETTGQEAQKSSSIHYLPRKQGTRNKTFLCVVCDVSLDMNPNTIIAHYNSKLHKDKARQFIDDKLDSSRASSRLSTASNQSTVSNSVNSNLTNPVKYDLVVDGFCFVCNVKVPNNYDNIKSHVDGKVHKQKMEIMKTSVNYNCQICNVNVPQNISNINEHFQGARHKANLAVHEAKKKAQNDANAAALGPSKITLGEKAKTYNKIFRNFNSNTNTDNASFASTSKAQPTAISNKPANNEETSNNYACHACNIEVPNTLYNVHQHLNGSRHKTNIANPMKANKTENPKKYPTNDIIKNSANSAVKYAKETNVSNSETNFGSSKVSNEVDDKPYLSIDTEASNSTTKNTEETEHLNIIRRYGNIVSIVKNNVVCQVCDVKIKINNPHNLKHHLEGGKHKSNLKKLKESNTESIQKEISDTIGDTLLQSQANKVELVSSMLTDNSDIIDGKTVSKIDTTQDLDKPQSSVNNTDTSELEIKHSETQPPLKIENTEKIQQDTCTFLNMTQYKSDKYENSHSESNVTIYDTPEPSINIMEVIKEDGDNMPDKSEKSTRIVTKASEKETKICHAADVKPDVSDKTQPKTEIRDAIQLKIDNFDIAQSKTDNSDIAQSKTDNSDIAQSKTDNSDIAQSKTDNSDIAQSKTDNSDIAQSKTDNSDIAQSKTDNSDIAQSKTDNSNIAQSKTDNSDIAQSKTDNTAKTQSGIDDSKTAKDEKESTGFYICSICNFSVPNDPVEIKSHLGSYRHVSNVKLQKEKVESEDLTDDSYTCEICNVGLYKNTIKIKEHFETGSHIRKFELLLLKNRIELKNNVCYCKVCDMYFNKHSVGMHVARENHTTMLENHN